MRRSLRAVVALLFCSFLVLPLSGAEATIGVTPSDSPYGANDWTCKPTAAHPDPVVLVHGTFENQGTNFGLLSWALKASGYCVFALDYGNNGTGPVAYSAYQLAWFVNDVLTATGAAKVDLVGHSQGGLMPRYYIKYLGGADKVDDLVGITPSNHGSSLSAVLSLTSCIACQDQYVGSPFLTLLNSGDETPGSVSYTDIVSKYDNVILPYTSGFLSGPNTTNVVIQNLCPNDLVKHANSPQDWPIIQVVLNALAVPGPASATFKPTC